MATGPQVQNPAPDVFSAAVKVMRIATGRDDATEVASALERSPKGRVKAAKVHVAKLTERLPAETAHVAAAPDPAPGGPYKKAGVSQCRG